MRGSMLDNGAVAADAYLAWWSLAGVDCAMAEKPVNWLRPSVAPLAGASPSPQSVGPSRPATLEAFAAWAATDPARPERNWPGTLILPTCRVGAPLMIVSDMPDQADMAAGALFTGKAGDLLDAMLRAIGIARADVAITSLFLARPPGGMVEASDLDIAAQRMRLLLSLTAPSRALLLGDRTARALLPADGSEGLRTLNHDGGTVAAVATFHPRLLLGQPAAKAECWRALLELIKDDIR